MEKVATLTVLVEELFSDLDAERFERISQQATDDVQGVDEISRRWLRGRPAMDGYFDGLRGKIAGIRSTFTDAHESEWGDVGLVTGTLEQTYSLAGQGQTLVAPTSILFRREGGTWKLALVHSVPLPEA